MPHISPDLSVNIINTFYLLFVHNYIVFAYFTGLLISLYLSLKKPSRYAIFLIIGFALLTFSFEYDKHIVEGLRQQTINSLITASPHYTAQKWVNLVLSDILPVFFYLSGWSCLFISLFLGSKKE